MNLNPVEKSIIELTKKMATSRVRALPEGFMNCGFLWGYVRIRRAQKNGKVRTFDIKTLLCSASPASWSDAEAAALAIPGVVSTFYNMD